MLKKIQIHFGKLFNQNKQRLKENNMNRSIAPIIKPIQKIELLDAQFITLSNHLNLYLLEGGSQEVISLEIVFKAGRWQENKPLQSLLTSLMIKEGTTEKTSNEINSKIDFHGAHISVSGGYDSTTVQLVTLNKHLKPMLDILVELLTSPSFSNEELEIKKNKMKQRLLINEEKTDYIAQRSFHVNMFGKQHPYGYASSKEKYEAITSSDLTNFFNANYTAKNCFAILAGKFNSASLTAIEQALAQILSANSSNLEQTYLAQTKIGQTHISKENAQQASIRIGMPTIAHNHEDYTPLQVLSTVLGGYFGSRLMANIREDKGYTYGIYSMLSAFKHQGYFIISTDVGVHQAEDAVKEIYAEINRLKETEIPEEELQLVKNYIMGKLLSQVDGPFAQARIIKGLISRNENASHFQKRIQAIQSTTPKQLIGLANQYFTQDSFVQVVVGK